MLSHCSAKVISEELEDQQALAQLLLGNEPQEEPELELEESGPPVEDQTEAEAGHVPLAGRDDGSQCWPQQIISLQYNQPRIWHFSEAETLGCRSDLPLLNCFTVAMKV